MTVSLDSPIILEKHTLFAYETFDCDSHFNQKEMITSWNIWVFHDKENWHISFRLSDRSKVTQNKINFIKNCPPWGLNPWHPDHHSNALPTELGRNLLGIRFLKWAMFVSCTTSHVGLSRINGAWLYKGLNDSHRQPNSDNSAGRSLEWWSTGCGVIL